MTDELPPASEVFPPSSSLAVQWYRDPEKGGYVTDWLYDGEQPPLADSDGVAVVFDGEFEDAVEVFVEYDADGDGDVDATSEPREVSSAGRVVTFTKRQGEPDSERRHATNTESGFGGSGWYRVGVRNVGDCVISDVSVGSVHENV